MKLNPLLLIIEFYILYWPGRLHKPIPVLLHVPYRIIERINYINFESLEEYLTELLHSNSLYIWLFQDAFFEHIGIIRILSVIS